MSGVQAVTKTELGRRDRTTIVLGRHDFLLNTGLKVLLRSHPLYEITAEDLDLPAMEVLAAHCSPDVAVLPVEADYDAVAYFAAQLPSVGIIILAHEPPFDLGASYLAQGATCVATNIPAARLMYAIDSSHRGVPIFISASGAAVTRANHDTSALTTRQQQVLTRVVMRRSYAQIALELQITVETVRKHTANIRTKLGADSLYDLICRPVDDRDGSRAGQMAPHECSNSHTRNFRLPGIDAAPHPR